MKTLAKVFLLAIFVTTIFSQSTSILDFFKKSNGGSSTSPPSSSPPPKKCAVGY
jgi:hypothetical protein